MKGGKAKADSPQENAAGAVDVDATGADGGTEAAAVSPAQTPSAPYQELLTTWWTTAALAWGPPVRMWSEIVTAAWRPFLPPTALTTEKPAPGVPRRSPPRRWTAGAAGTAGGGPDTPGRGAEKPRFGHRPSAAGGALETLGRFIGSARRVTDAAGMVASGMGR